MKIKQILIVTTFLCLTGCLAAQNNDNLRGRINDRPNQAVQRRPNAPQKTDQRMPDVMSDCQRDGLRGEVQDVMSVMYEAERDNHRDHKSCRRRNDAGDRRARRKEVHRKEHQQRAVIDRQS